MNFRKMRLTLPALFAIAAIAIASSAHAQVSGSFRVSFGNTPRWTMVPGTRVEVVRDIDRGDYDVFRYGGSYYAYSNGRWYSSPRMMGDYGYIEDTMVPSEISMVPQAQWRSYPTRWASRERDWDRSQDNLSFRVSFNSRPRWESVRGSRVRMIRTSDRPAYDMFQYNGRYYVYNNGRWYQSRNWRGNFAYVETGRVPREFRRVPRTYWRDYAYENDYYGGRYHYNDHDSRYRR